MEVKQQQCYGESGDKMVQDLMDKKMQDMQERRKEREKKESCLTFSERMLSSTKMRRTYKQMDSVNALGSFKDYFE